MSREPSAAVANPDPLPRIGLRVGIETRSPGRVEWRPEIDHRLKIHAGAPVVASCGTGRFLYTRGDVDICVHRAALRRSWR